MVVTREAEWDASARGRALRLLAYEQSIDKLTGLPIADAYANQPFVVHSDLVNFAARAIDRQKALDSDAHKDDERWLDHRTYTVRLPTAAELPTPD